MTVEQYGLKYTRLTENDLELVRYWRNQSFIRNIMQFKDYITPEMQQNWFHKINNKYNYYMIIHHGNNKVGMINCKDTEMGQKIAEGGIFIWDKQYWSTPVPVLAALTVLECVFEVFKSGEASVATISPENERALSFNKMLGYRYHETAPNGFLKLILTKDDYFNTTTKLKKAAALYTAGKTKINITAEPGELLADEINQFLANLRS
jgi:UDP-4-amino-4,6-dideoxy-N-acetyl-beta-L-altrosamine N-acetyltransferase